MVAWIKKQTFYISITGLLALFAFAWLFLPKIFSEDYQSNPDILGADIGEDDVGPIEEAFVATHLETPSPVKALYMTSWIAGRSDLRPRVINLIENTELNSVVIDIKDDTGRISFEVYDTELKKVGSEEVRIADLREFIAELHKKNIYVIGRISSFQDPYMTNLHPEWAVKRESDGAVWKDRKGLSWVDPGAKPMWDYLYLIGKESYNAGFDELNYDYIRFPSDGNMQDIAYPWSGTTTKPVIIKEYFKYLTNKLKNPEPDSGQTGIPVVSADLFGMTTVAMPGFDLNIGQILEDAVYYFDYVAPMVYPSHYPPYFQGYPDPNKVPYDIIKISMDGAHDKITALSSTSPKYDFNKIRPWLQDFDYGGEYGVAEVRAQIQAVYDSGLDSFMIWDPSNRYTHGAYQIKANEVPTITPQVVE